MRSSWYLVRKISLGEAILKYANNMDSKDEIDVWMESSRKNRLFKKNGTENGLQM
jgi:hypothetical protein